MELRRQCGALALQRVVRYFCAVNYRILDDASVEHFLEHGYISMRGCFEFSQVAEWLDLGWQRLGYDRNDPATWVNARVHQPWTQGVKVREFAPEVFDAMCDLCGGQERIEEPYFGDSFIWNLGIGKDQPWQSPQELSNGWHKDGDFFRHFLDSPEQGLLLIALYSDIEPQGGGTFLANDSVPVVARYLADHPEGVLPDDFPFRALKSECREFTEATGKLGDVFLMHPFLLHTASQNVRGTARAITNPLARLREPMQFNRADGDYSPVERAILRGLNVEHLDFQPTAPREHVTPYRERVQQKMREEEAARLAAAET